MWDMITEDSGYGYEYTICGSFVCVIGIQTPGDPKYWDRWKDHVHVADPLVFAIIGRDPRDRAHNERLVNEVA